MQFMSASTFTKTRQIAEQGIERNLHTAVQITAFKDGELLESSIGEAKPGVVLTSEHAFPWLSSGKPITALAVLKFVDRGLISQDEPVATCIPEFGVNGKDRITLRQLLTHTAGLQLVVLNWPELNWDTIIPQICQREQIADWDSNNRAAYDPHHTWFLLGEILQRASGKSYADTVIDEVLKPIGMHHTQLAFGIPHTDSLELVTMYERQAGQLAESDWNSKIESAIPSPGSSLRGRPADLCQFFTCLMKNTDTEGQPLLSENLHREMISRQREGLFDETLQHIVDYGLGMIIDSNRYGFETVPYGFGKHCSARTFGHGGSQCAIGFADPEYDLAVVITSNGRPGEGQHQRRFRALCTAVYEDLGIA